MENLIISGHVRHRRLLALRRAASELLLETAYQVRRRAMRPLHRVLCTMPLLLVVRTEWQLRSGDLSNWIAPLLVKCPAATPSAVLIAFPPVPRFVRKTPSRLPRPRR